jgi:hypothetical protein
MAKIAFLGLAVTGVEIALTGVTAAVTFEPALRYYPS